MDLQLTFRSALIHQQAGRLGDAEQLLRQILTQQPNQPDALHLFGLIAHQAGRLDVAEQFLRRALILCPHMPEAFCNLGNCLKDQGRLDEAIAAYHQAIAIKPAFAEAFYNLGLTLKCRGNVAEAVAAYRQAIAFNARLLDAHTNLAAALRELGQFDEAICAARLAIDLQPKKSAGYYQLGAALQCKRALDEADGAYRRAIALDPANAFAYHRLGALLQQRGELEKAVEAYRQAIACNPKVAPFHNNLGNALNELGRPDEAIAAYHEAMALDPSLPQVYVNLADALRDKGRIDESVLACEQALALAPGYAEAQNHLGNALRDAGRLDEAIAAYRQAMMLRPADVEADSNMLACIQYHSAYDAVAIAREQQRWNLEHALSVPRRSGYASHDRTPDRPLRIGYVSADFRDHVVGRNILPLFQHHDQNAFEIYAYAQVTRPDAFTQRFQPLTRHWRSLVGMPDQEAADLIQQDRIDILVDLSLHTAGHRLLVFARKPAPVQVTFAGYPGSTGLTAIDYRLSDPSLDPPGMDESVYSEKTVRLPHSFWCYEPLEGRDIAVNDLPARSNGHITFGCLNNFCKVNRDVLALWASVMRETPASRLLLLAPEGRHRQEALAYMEQQGVAAERIAWVPRLSRAEYFRTFNRIDIGLDTFPYNGHTTSLDSFWMGVPVVTRIGQTVVGRAGLCQLNNLDLPDLAARTDEEFVAICTRLSRDLDGLGELRNTLRPRMENSALMRADLFAASIEDAYRRMWSDWCGRRSAAS